MPDSRSEHSKPAAVPSDADMARGRLMQGALKTLLNRVRGARDVLPHLAALEVALGRHGVAAVSGLAPQWVPKMYSQLSSLPISANEPLLLDLQQRLFEALPARPAPVAAASPRSAPPREYLSDFDSGNGMVVGEASHTDFMREIDAV
jgi:hypothetical protein